jgi:hypothetical protein
VFLEIRAAKKDTNPRSSPYQKMQMQPLVTFQAYNFASKTHSGKSQRPTMRFTDQRPCVSSE